MSNNQRRFFKQAVNLALVPLIGLTTVYSGTTTASVIFNSKQTHPQLIAQNFSGFIASFWQRRPRKRNVSRGEICPIAPGLVETYLVWHDKPLFLWKSKDKSEPVNLIVRDYDTQAVIWQQNVDLATQKLSYGGSQPLEAGKLYQWQLSGKTSSPWITFKIMPSSEREKIASDLQTLEQQLKTSRTSPEEVAIRKADYFLNYKINHRTETGTFHAWSDALQVLTEVSNPSADFLKKREQFVNSVCSPPPSTARQP